MEAQLRSYLNDHATAWWAYMKKGEWAEQIGSFIRDALYITVMFILIPTTALVLYSLLVTGKFIGKGINLIALRENAARAESENKLSFFTLLSQWFNRQPVNQVLPNVVKVQDQDIVRASPESSNNSLHFDLRNNKASSNIYPTLDASENLVGASTPEKQDINKEVGLHYTAPVELYGSLNSSEVSPEFERPTSFQSNIHPVNKLEEDSPF